MRHACPHEFYLRTHTDTYMHVTMHACMTLAEHVPKYSWGDRRSFQGSMNHLLRRYALITF